MTTEQLKDILDRGGVITDGTDQIYRPSPTDEKYALKGLDCNMFWWDGVLKYCITNPSDWSEVKRELPESSGVSEVLGAIGAYKADVERNGGFMVVERREWESLQKELHELRRNSQNTFDPITIEQKEWIKQNSK